MVFRIRAKKMKTATENVIVGRKMSRIDKTALVLLFDVIDKGGNSFLQIFTRTVPTMRKTGNRFVGKVEKVTETNCQAGWIYENSVNLQREREDVEEEFVSQPRRWGKHKINQLTGKTSKIMLDHTDKKEQYKEYAHLRPLNVKSSVYVWSGTDDELTEAEVEELKTFIPEKVKSKTQETEKEIFVTDYNIENIEAMVWLNTLFFIS
jgi:hypothetical protein